MSKVEHKRRVAACLKACAGISTKNLEENIPIRELLELYNAALKQRDELEDKLLVKQAADERRWAANRCAS